MQNQELLNQVDLITKEKNALESQLVIIKLKYAELNSNYGELQDQKTSLVRKVEELNEKLQLKEEVIKHFLNENFEKTTSNKTTSLSNPSVKKDDLKRINSTNLITNGYSNNSFTQRASMTEKPFTSNFNHTIVESSDEVNIVDKNLKRMDYNNETQQNYKFNGYINTTVGNEHLDSLTNRDISNTLSYSTNNKYNQTEHQQKIENYRSSQRTHKNKSFGFLGSIKNFFTNDSKK